VKEPTNEPEEVMMNAHSNADLVEATTNPSTNTVVRGDCIQMMRTMRGNSVDLIVTDPPYLVNYRSRDGRGYPNDDNDRWLEPAFAEAFRVLRPNRVCVSLYGWPRADRFLAAWRSVGFRPIAHLVKRYASAVRFVRYQHEQAYVLAKGRPVNPSEPIGDVITWDYPGNRLHPSQKSVSVFAPRIRAFSEPGELVLDPFCGSGSSLVAVRDLGRAYLGVELTHRYCQIAASRLTRGIAV
jgi:site-specific DNA-methyltransferase (adenine-specific)